MAEAASRHGVLAAGLLLLACAVAELSQHILSLPGTIGAVALLLGLAPIAYAGLRARLPVALALTVALAAYTLHWTSPHAQVARLDGQGWAAFAAMLLLGIGMVAPMAIVQSRETKLRSAVDARTRELETRNRELVDANAALEAFGYVVSHDLKEPVRAIENYLDAAREEWGAAEARAFVEEAYQANQRLARLLQGLLEYSRTSSGWTRTQPTRVADAVASDVCRSRYAVLARERGAFIEVEDDIPPIEGDDVLLGQLLGNLILNGIRHNPKPAPRVRIRRASDEEDGVHIVVEDDGPGYPREVIERVRDLRTQRPATVKGGFGLVISHRAAQRLGGRMWLANGPHGGEAHIVLPAARTEVPVDGAHSGGATVRSTAK